MNMRFFISICAIAATVICVAPLQSQPPVPNSRSESRTTEEVSRPQAPGGGHGLVWANTEAGVFHTERSPFYGTTRKGKYMTEQDAIEAGYKRATKER